MSTTATKGLANRQCASCEGGVPPLSGEEVKGYLTEVPEWKLSADGKRIRREWRVKDFLAGLDFFNRIGKLAEQEDHQPDLHLTGYHYLPITISQPYNRRLPSDAFIMR